jgi:hypothetical protein
VRRRNKPHHNGCHGYVSAGNGVPHEVSSRDGSDASLRFAPTSLGQKLPVSSEQQASSERVRKNEETFANANEEIRARAEQYEFDEAVPFLCECSKVDCTETIRLPLPTYREARARGDAFILRAGHDDPRVEHIIGNVAGYILVEKFS